MIKKLGITILYAFILAGCVPQKKYDDLQAKYYKSLAENVKLKSAHDELLKLKEVQEQLLAEKNKLDQEYRDLLAEQDALQKGYDTLIGEYDQLSGRNQLTEEEKQKLQTALSQKESLLHSKESELAKNKSELQKKIDRINELERLLSQQKEALGKLKKSMTDALVGYEGKGITIVEKNGRVYVSMDNKLLFQSGKWNVENEGRNALAKIAGVLKSQSDIDILIEGHTDNIPFAGSQAIDDNWDLSVKRATSITKILQNLGVNPSHMTAGGRSEYDPIKSNSTSAGRAANRRVEIILTPDLKKINDLLNQL